MEPLDTPEAVGVSKSGYLRAPNKSGSLWVAQVGAPWKTVQTWPPLPSVPVTQQSVPWVLWT